MIGEWVIVYTLKVQGILRMTIIIVLMEKGERMIRVLEPDKDYIIRADRSGIVVDVVEVVRCKDCKWYEESKHSELQSLRFCYRLRNDNGVPVGYNWDGNDFCSYGERREDAE